MSLLTSVLKVADSVTKSLKLQTTVTFERYLSSDSYGKEIYGSPVPLSAVLEFKQRSVRTLNGELAQSTATLTLLDLPATVLATPTVVGGGKASWVFTKDRITLPNGSTQPVLNIGGFVDGGDGQLIPTEVYLG